jgi:hypothetical protein
MCRFSTVIARLAVVGGLVAATAAVAAPPAAPQPGAAVRQEVRDDWDYQYGRLGAPFGKPYIQGSDEVDDGIHLMQNDPDAPVDEPYLLDRHAAIWPEDRDQADVVLRRTKALLAHLKVAHPALAVWGPLQTRLDDLAAQAAKTAPDRTGADAGRMAVYRGLCALRRETALANPLLDFDDVLFAEVSYAGRGNERLPDAQDWRWVNKNVYPGGGLHVLKNWKTEKPTLVDLCAKAAPASGPYQARCLSKGTFFSPSLSYDGRTVYFSWSDPTAEPDLCRNQGPGRYAHIFRVNIDGTDLRQLTFGPYNDLDPVELPDGRIVFTSTRRESTDRCGDHPNPTSTFLHSMKPDGSDIICLSFHETHEFEPSVDNDGMIVYSRWDYVDRMVRRATCLWRCYPDGRDPRAPHGNYWYPLFDGLPGGKAVSPHPFPAQGGRAGGKGQGPRWAQMPESELSIRAIPGTRGKYTALAGMSTRMGGSAMGGIGIPILINLSRPDDYQHGQITRITQDQIKTYLWGTPWPLSEDFYLINYLDRLYLLDRFGNRELIYHMKAARELSATKNSIHTRDAVEYLNSTRVKQTLSPADRIPLAHYSGQMLGWRPFHPIPVRASVRPPVLPTLTYQSADRRGLPDHRPATLAVMNVYEADVPLPPNVTIKWLRLVQTLNVTSGCYRPVKPNFELMLERLPLGVVPVEEDGSVYCLAPIERGLIFQLLDENGLAIQSMRSLTYVHPGEQLTCVGCHEPYDRPAKPVGGLPLALRRAPSEIQPEFPEGVVPPDYARQIAPIFERTCVGCHLKEGKGPKAIYVGKHKSRAEGDLVSNAKGDRAPRWIPDTRTNTSRTTPGHMGALGSLLWQHVQKRRDAFTKDELKRVAWWLDLSCPQTGIYGTFFKEVNGIRWPTRPDVDPENPLGVEILPQAGRHVDSKDVLRAGFALTVDPMREGATP